MHSVEESLLRNRNSVGSEIDTASGREGASRREGEREKKNIREISEAVLIQVEKACYEAAIQS
jgi:hypothetical protein